MPLMSQMGRKQTSGQWPESDLAVFLLNIRMIESFSRPMSSEAANSNDNQPPSRAELEAANRELKASLKRCEELVADCRDRLVAVDGLKLPQGERGDS